MTSKVKVLVVEDDDDLRLGLTVCIRALGHDVVVARDGVGAISVAKQEQPDLVLLDIGLPAGNGIAVLECYSTLPALCAIPVVVLTGRDPRAVEPLLRKFHIAGFLRKPAESDVLAEMIARAARRDPIVAT